MRVGSSYLGHDKIEAKNVLPLVDMFRNHKIEFGFSLQNIQTIFETFQLQPAFA